MGAGELEKIKGVARKVQPHYRWERQRQEAARRHRQQENPIRRSDSEGRGPVGTSGDGRDLSHLQDRGRAKARPSLGPGSEGLNHPSPFSLPAHLQPSQEGLLPLSGVTEMGKYLSF